jgi:hypothetical protein
MTFSNILHKKNVRVANLEQVAGAFKEANRNRVDKSVTADNTAVRTIVAPWSGFVEELNIAGPSATVSSAGNSITVSVINVTQSSAVVATFDTVLNATELLADQGIKVSFAPALSGGVALTQFNRGDVLSLIVALNGTVSGWSTASVVQINAAFVPNDKQYAF